MSQFRHIAVIPAAGVGARMNAACPKQYIPLAGKPMLLHTLNAFAATTMIDHVYLVVSPEDAYIDEALRDAGQLSGRITVLRRGGATRHASVLNGLHAIRDMAADEDWILVHDAARPGITSDMIERLSTALHDDPVGGLLALPVVDTIKRESGDARVEVTVPRDMLWAAQTPQMFRYALLLRALTQAPSVTDEAGAVEALGLRPKLIAGSARNFKVTLPHDVALAELYVKGLA